MKPLRTLVIGLMLMATAPVYAQGEPGDDPDAPIDGGVVLLIAGSIGYGLKKAHNIKRTNDVNRKNGS